MSDLTVERVVEIFDVRVVDPVDSEFEAWGQAEVAGPCEIPNDAYGHPVECHNLAEWRVVFAPTCACEDLVRSSLTCTPHKDQIVTAGAASPLVCQICFAPAPIRWIDRFRTGP